MLAKALSLSSEISIKSNSFSENKVLNRDLFNRFQWLIPQSILIRVIYFKVLKWFLWSCNTIQTIKLSPKIIAITLKCEIIQLQAGQPVKVSLESHWIFVGLLQLGNSKLINLKSSLTQKSPADRLLIVHFEHSDFVTLKHWNNKPINHGLNSLKAIPAHKVSVTNSTLSTRYLHAITWFLFIFTFAIFVSFGFFVRHRHQT